MAQYRYFDRQIKRIPYFYGEDQEEKRTTFIKNLELGEIFIHPYLGGWQNIQKIFEDNGMKIERYTFKHKRMAKQFHHCAAIVVQKGDEMYDHPDAKEQQTFDVNSLMT